MTVQHELESFYSTYLTHWNARAFDKVAACFVEPAMFVLPTGAVALPDRAAMVALLQGLFAQMEADGFSHTTAGPVTGRVCGPDLAILDAAKLCRWRADGSLMEEIDGHYVLHRRDGIWRATVAVACAPGWHG